MAAPAQGLGGPAPEEPLSESIPLVDLRDWSDPARRAEFVRTLGEGLEQFGFVAVIGHGVDPERLEALYASARDLFALPEAAKRRYETPEDGRQRGYTSFGVEHAKDTLVPDLKEFWHVGRSLGADHPLHVSGDVPPNLWPAELPEFRERFSEYYRDIEAFAGRLLAAVALYLGHDERYFERLTHDGNSVLRIIHYPDTPDAAPGAVRAAAHEDINLLTVLPVSTRPGLEVMTRDGRWLAVNPGPNVMVCDTGDMMAVLTNGRLPATTHRVVNPERQDGGRLSMPFFLHPHPDALLSPGVPGISPPVRTREFFHARLRDIGVERR